MTIKEELEELEEKELREIVKSGIPKKVSEEKYNKNFCPGWCRYCIHYNWDLEKCSYKREYYNDNNEDVECEYWEYVYTK